MVEVREAAVGGHFAGSQRQALAARVTQLTLIRREYTAITAFCSAGMRIAISPAGHFFDGPDYESCLLDWIHTLAFTLMH